MSVLSDLQGLVVAPVGGGGPRAWGAFALEGGAPGRALGLVTGDAPVAARPLLTIGPPRPVPVGSRRAVHDADGMLLGELEHRYQLSLMRSPWAVVGPPGAGVLAWTREPSAPAALARRLRPGRPPHTVVIAGQRPAAEVVPAPGARGGWQAGLDDLPPEALDRRLLLALMVALGACRR